MMHSKVSIKLVWLIFTLLPSLAVGECRVPFSLSFSERTTTSIRIKWSDGNTSPIGWELEVVKRGTARTGTPNYPMALKRDITLSDLTPSTAYELYIRAICSPGQASNWNVAIPFTTVLSNPTACQINIPLKDNGTEILFLDGGEKGILGKDVFLQSIDMVVAHDWPADLKITLESPQGQSLVLSSHNGTVKDDFGDINDVTCGRVTRFSPDACYSLKDNSPPFIGTFSTDGSIRDWKPDTLSKGHWKLIFTDRAVKDAGVLKYVKLNFNRQSCIPPTNFRVTAVDARQINLQWGAVQGCNTVKIGVRVNGVPKDTLFIQCSDQIYFYRNLLPDTDYEFFIASICGTFDQSTESCRISARTRCESITLSDSFDNLPTCGEGCANSCRNTGSLWFNVQETDDQDWLVWQGNTDTENTGPEGDVNGPGKYLYLENNPTICGTTGTAILQSQCIDILSNASSCDLAFSYHMYGADIDTLLVEISLDNGNTWQSLFLLAGNQGNKWHRKVLSLAPYHGRKGIFRFVAKTGNGPLADIAIDAIEFYSSRQASLSNRFYKDADGDGIGSEDSFTDLCQSIPPTGFVTTTGDCNDTDSNIYPGAIEIACNGRDENCNGLDDDQDKTTGLQLSVNKSDASCNGSKDGWIRMHISGGKPPYSFQWANGETSDSIYNLSAGFYDGYVSDSTGCTARIPLIEILTTTQLNIINTGLIAPTCQGKGDGAIFIEHNTDNPPYSYLWSDGSTSKYLTNIYEGSYSVTVTDQKNCFAKLNHIQLAARPTLTTNIKQIRQPLCTGQATGAVELITVNGQPPYTYAWSSGNTSAAIQNLTEGAYTCTITDNQGCQQDFTVQIKAPTPLQTSILSTEDVRCYGEKNGSVKTDTKGGKTPYTYFWNNFLFTDDIFELEAGTYSLTVTDANGCTFITKGVDIRQPEPFILSLDTIQPATCLKGANGVASILATGGNGGFNFIWSHSQMNVPAFKDLQPGNYSVTAYDKFGCKSGIPNFTIDYVNIPIDINVTVVDSIRCHQSPDGSLVVSLAKGNAPFDFNWSHGLQYYKAYSPDTLTSLKAGNYILTVTDNIGCTGISDVVVLPDKPALNYSVSEATPNVCAGDLDGKITITTVGGTPPYSILWNNGNRSGSTLVSLPDGNYSGWITDKKQCLQEISTIPLVPLSDMQLSAVLRNATDQLSNGEICLSLSGGLPPYSFAWNVTGQKEECLRNLLPGTFFVTITDGAGCVIDSAFTIGKTSSIGNVQSQKISLFPTPSSSWVQVISEIPVTEINIFTMEGRILPICSEPLASGINSTALDISCLPTGFYVCMVKLQTGEYKFMPLMVVR